MSALKFYHANNANRRIQSNGLSFTFQTYDYFGGTWRGVYATSDEKEIAALDALVADKTSAVTAITQEVYEVKAKKKANEPINLQTSVTPLSNPKVRVIQSNATVVENPGPENQPLPKVTSDPLPTVNDALNVGPVTPAVESAPAKPKAAKQAKKSE